MNESALTSAFLVSYALLWIIALGLCVMMVAVLRHLGLLFEAVGPILRFGTNAAELRVGELVPHLSFEEPGHGVVALQRFLGSFLFILVIEPGCQPCENIVRGARAEIEQAGLVGWRLLLILRSDTAATSRWWDDHQLGDDVKVVADPSSGTARLWGVTATPFGLVVDPAGRIQRKLFPVTVEHLRGILKAPPAGQVGPITAGDGRPREPEVTFQGRGNGA